MANYELKITVLTPLHIGAGEELRQGFDFMNAWAAVHLPPECG